MKASSSAYNMLQPLERLQLALVMAAVVCVSATGVRIATITLTDFLFVGAAMLGLLRLEIIKQYIRTINVFYICGVLLVILGGFISQRDVINVSDEINNTIKLIFLFILFIPMIGLSARGPKLIMALLLSYVGIPIVATIGALLEYAMGWHVQGDQVSEFGYGGAGGRIAGFTLHPNELGIVVSLVVPLAMALALESRIYLIRLYSYISLVGSVICIVLSQCFTGAIGAGLGVMSLVPYMIKNSRKHVHNKEIFIYGAIAIVLWGGRRCIRERFRRIYGSCA